MLFRAGQTITYRPSFAENENRRTRVWCVPLDLDEMGDDAICQVQQLLHLIINGIHNGQTTQSVVVEAKRDRATTHRQVKVV